jgi:hypothetical protein
VQDSEDTLGVAAFNLVNDSSTNNNTALTPVCSRWLVRCWPTIHAAVRQ